MKKHDHIQYLHSNLHENYPNREVYALYYKHK